MEIIPANRTASDYERVYKYLRELILTGRLKPQERIVENTYASIFDISRTPVREALRQLERDGLVKIIPKRGAIVRMPPTREEVKEVFAIRGALQLLSVDKTLERITDETLLEMQFCLDECAKDIEADNIVHFCINHDRFNSLLIHACRMKVLIGVLVQMENYDPFMSFTGEANNYDTSNLRRVSLPRKQRWAQTLAEHQEIYAALKAKDRDRFIKALDDHLKNSEQVYLDLIGDIGKSGS